MARGTSARSTAEQRDRVIAAALELAAERDWETVRLADIAERAGIALSELRGMFNGRLDILAGFSAMIDRQVLDSLDPELAEEPARDRIFDVLMARFDALGPHREAVRSIVRALNKRPARLAASNPITVRSMAWMLEGAGIDASGRFGALRAQGLAWAYGRTLRVWLADDDPGMARTMVELDRRLRDGEVWLDRAAGLCSLLRRGRGRRRRDRTADEAPNAEAGPEASPG